MQCISILGIAVAAAGCMSSTEGSSITNGATQSALTTYWESSGSTGCIVGNGNGGCFGPLDFALAEDGTAMWSSRYGCCGTSTWVKVGGGTTVILADPPLSSGGLNISNITGSTDQGVFTGDASGYFAIRFTLQVGQVPGSCAHSVLVPNAGGCMVQ
jgi:hypothetical protein